jgi:uncharacterized membrane protein
MAARAPRRQIGGIAMKNSKIFLIPVSIITLLSLISIGIIYPIIPSQIPSHWNSNGEVDEYAPKVYIWLLAVLPLISSIAFVTISRIDPRKENFEKHLIAYRVIAVGMTTIFYVVFLLVLLSSLGTVFDVRFIFALLVGVFLVLLGNFSPQIRFNFMFGIRTPWTLANETVWRKTHRMAGYVFVIIGLLLMFRLLLLSISWLNQVTLNTLMAAILLTGLVFVTAYSYFIFVKEKEASFTVHGADNSK